METVKTTWAIDPYHSEILFKVKHLVISTVSGKFEKFEGSVITNGDDWNNAAVEFSADIDSINTGVGDLASACAKWGEQRAAMATGMWALVGVQLMEEKRGQVEG